MSGPRDWVRRMLTPAEQDRLLHIRHEKRVATIRWTMMEPISRLAVAELVNLKLVVWRRRFWLFGRQYFMLTRKGHRWAALLDQSRGMKS